jgi:hypothetical protein
LNNDRHPSDCDLLDRHNSNERVNQSAPLFACVHFNQIDRKLNKYEEKESDDLKEEASDDWRQNNIVWKYRPKKKSI